MEELTLETFRPHQGSTFQLMVNEEPALELELAEVEDLSKPGRTVGGRVRSDPFSLVFQGPLDPMANQQIHDLKHAQLGHLQIFLVPIGPDSTGQKLCYQAIFN